nr:MAG TPA: hypothetical protein [Caudoviricetes sp.]
MTQHRKTDRPHQASLTLVATNPHDSAKNATSRQTLTPLMSSFASHVTSRVT